MTHYLLPHSKGGLTGKKSAGAQLSTYNSDPQASMRLRSSPRPLALLVVFGLAQLVSSCSEGDTDDTLGVGGAPTGAGGLASGGSDAVGGSPASGGRESVAVDCKTLTPVHFQTVIECVFEAGCANSLCHSGEQAPDLTGDAGLHDRLMNTLSEHCGNAPLIAPGNPEGSAIIMALTRQCDDPTWGMPDGCIEPDGEPCIPQEYVDVVYDWILAGAQP